MKSLYAKRKVFIAYMQKTDLEHPRYLKLENSNWNFQFHEQIFLNFWSKIANTSWNAYCLASSWQDSIIKMQ